MSQDVYTLPPGLPVPEDDGAADHIAGLELPDLTLQSSRGEVNVRGFGVIYIYPRSGRPGVLPGRGRGGRRTRTRRGRARVAAPR